MLKIIFGPAKSGKTQAIMDEMKARAAQGRPSRLVLPESYSHHGEKQLLALCGNSLGRFAQVTTFSKMTRDVLAACGVGGRWLTPSGKILYMHRALMGVAPNLEFYKKGAGPKMISKMLETIDELQSGGISPEDMVKAVYEEDLSPKLKDLATIYSAYWAAVLHGKLDPADPLEAAIDNLHKLPGIKGTSFFFDSFSGFTKIRRRAIEALLSLGCDVTVSLLIDDDEFLFTQQRKTLAQLKALGGEKTRVISMGEKSPQAAKKAALAAFDFSANRQELPGLNIDFYSCKNPMEECHLAAGLCRRELLHGGVRAREIAVVCSDLEHYGPYIESAFKAFDVPVFVSVKEGITSMPPVKGALGAAEAIEKGLTLESVFSWLKSGLTPLTPEKRDKLENYALLWGIRGKKWLKPFTYSTGGYGRPHPNEGEKLAELEAIRTEIASELAILSENLAKCTLGDEFAAEMAAHLQRTAMETRIERAIAALEKEGRRRTALQYSQLYSAIIESLSQLSGAAGRQEMTLSDFLYMLNLSISQLAVDTIPVTLDSVQACDFNRFPMMGARRVIIIGAREGLLPKDRTGTGFLKESERIILDGAGITLTQSAEEIAFEDQSYIYRALSYGDSLTLIRPQTTEEGAEARPGSIFQRLLSILGGVEQSGTAKLNLLRLTCEKTAFDMACFGGGEKENSASLAAREYFDGIPKAGDFFRRLDEWGQNPRPPITRPHLVEKMYGNVLPMTASRAEGAASCRFSYFMGYGLGANPREVANFGAKEIGTFVHDAVEKTIAHMTNNPEALLKPTVDAICRSYTDRLYKDKTISSRTAGITEKLFDTVAIIAENVWEEIKAGSFKPLFFEMNFGQNGDAPPLEINAGGVKAHIRGKIDRVDGWVDGDTLYLKVVDYKTGKKKFRLSDIYYGLNMQMFIYLNMLSKSRNVLSKRAEEVLSRGAAAASAGAALYIPAEAPWADGDRLESKGSAQELIDNKRKRLGIVSDEKRVIDALEAPENGEYRFLPVSFLKSGSFSARSSVASPTEMDSLINHTKHTLEKLIKSIAEGDVSANPYRKGNGVTSCTFCPYKTACHFDESLKGDRFRAVPALSNKELFEILTEENGGEPNE